MSKGKIISLFDYTGIMVKPWADAGYECWCFDGQHPEGVTVEGNIRKVGMWFTPDHSSEQLAEIVKLVGSGVKMVFGFPDCTHLAVSGAAHFKKKLAENPNIQKDAATLAKFVGKVGDHYKVPWFAENPVSILSTLWRKPNFIFNPYEFGGYLSPGEPHPDYPEYIPPQDAYTKKTCLWTGGGFELPTKKVINTEAVEGQGGSKAHNKLGGKSQKTKNIRSATPRGFALAVYLKYGK